MFNNKIYIISCLLFIVSCVYGAQTLRKEDVLSINVEKEKDGQCPPYSMGPYDEKTCAYRFFCRDEVCYPVTNNSTNTVEFTNSNGQVETYNIDHWTESYEATKIPCSKDTDCFSNNCKQGICSLNNKASLTQCMDSHNYQYKEDFVKISFKVKMNCGKAAHVKCSSNSECASNNCVNGECNNDNYKPVGRSRALIYGIIVFVCFLLILGAIIYFSCRCCKSNKDKKDIKQPIYPNEKMKMKDFA